MTTAFHLKYRAKTLEDVVGHSAVVSTLLGIVKTKKFPSALAFFGRPSAGKTTLSRAFVANTLGLENVNGSDYTFANLGSQRSIEEIRELIGIAKLSPMGGRRRFVHLEEAQGILGNAPAAAALLEPLEHPHPRMTWIISSMSPEKFTQTENGRAILSRCQQFHLKPYTVEDLTKQANKIIRGESMSYMTKEVRSKIIEECGNEMRTLANLLQSISQYYDGLADDKKPDKLDIEVVEEVMQSATADDDKTAVRLLTCLYAGKIASAQREILNVSDGFGIINKMLYTNYAVMNDCILKGARHPKVWMTVPAKALRDNLNKLVTEEKERLKKLMKMQQALIQLKTQAQAFAVPEDMAMFDFGAKFLG